MNNGYGKQKNKVRIEIWLFYIRCESMKKPDLNFSYFFHFSFCSKGTGRRNQQFTQINLPNQCRHTHKVRTVRKTHFYAIRSDSWFLLDCFEGVFFHSRKQKNPNNRYWWKLIFRCTICKFENCQPQRWHNG